MAFREGSIKENINKKQMRIALLLYGRIEKFKECYEAMLDALGRQNTVDIFYSSDYESKENIAEFKELYKPIKCENKRIIHSNILCRYPNTLSYVDSNNFYRDECQYTNKMRVFMIFEEYLKETPVQYDLVICTRVDIEYCCMIPPIKPKENTIYIPTGSDYEGGINALFAMGSVEVIKKYCYLYKNFLYLLENKLSIPHPELLTLANLIYENVQIKRFSLTFFLEGRDGWGREGWRDTEKTKN